MKILFLLSDEPFHTPRCVRPLVEGWREHIAGAAFPRGFLSVKRTIATLRIYGPLEVARLGAGTAWSALRGGAVRRVFCEAGVAVHPVDDVNGTAFLALLRRLGVDLVVSLNCAQKLGPGVLRLPAHGCINVHFGQLPRYRGILPIMYALLNGEAEFGVTVHYMDEKLDNGGIILQETVPIGPTDTLETLYPKAFDLGGRLLAGAFQLIEAGAVVARPNPESAKTYYSYPSPEVARRYRRLARERRRGAAARATVRPPSASGATR